MPNVRMCTKCNVQSEVLDSRARKEGWHRRRQCPNCGRRWNTVEIPMDEYKVLMALANIDARLDRIAGDLETEAAAIRNFKETLKHTPPDDGRGD